MRTPTALRTLFQVNKQFLFLHIYAWGALVCIILELQLFFFFEFSWNASHICKIWTSTMPRVFVTRHGVVCLQQTADSPPILQVQYQGHIMDGCLFNVDNKGCLLYIYGSVPKGTLGRPPLTQWRRTFIFWPKLAEHSCDLFCIIGIEICKSMTSCHKGTQFDDVFLFLRYWRTVDLLDSVNYMRVYFLTDLHELVDKVIKEPCGEALLVLGYPPKLVRAAVTNLLNASGKLTSSGCI